MNETLSPIAEALKRAAERSSGSSDLHTQILKTAETIGVVTDQGTATPDVTFNPLHTQTDQVGEDEYLSVEALEELADSLVFPGNTRRKSAVRTQAEQAPLSEEEMNRRKAARIQARRLLMQTSTAPKQTPAEIEQERRVQAQAEEARQAQAARQEAVAARDRQKEENRLIAEKQRTEAAARREQKAKDSAAKREAKKAAQAAQPRRADIERQRRAVQEPQSELRPASARPAVKARPSRLTEEEQKKFEEAKEVCAQIGRDYFKLALVPIAAKLTGVKPEEVYDRIWNLVGQFKTYSPDQRVELVKQIALGMQISETGISPLYEKTYGSVNSHGQELGDVDYLLHSFSLLLGYFTDEQRLAFVNFIRSENVGKRMDLPLVHQATARWLAQLTE